MCGLIIVGDRRETIIGRMLLGSTSRHVLRQGQVLSTRPDVVGKRLADELAELRANTPADESAAISELIEQELGREMKRMIATLMGWSIFRQTKRRE